MDRRELFTLGLGLSGVAAGLTIAPKAIGQEASRPGIVVGAPTLTPLVVGGTLPASTLTLRATSGKGVGAEAIIFQVGINGATEALRLTQAILNSAPTSIANVKGNLLVQGLGDDSDQSAAIVVKAGFPGIDFFNTNYPTPVPERRIQILNSNDTHALEFNYFTGEGTEVQTGWAMFPTTGEFRATAGFITSALGFLTQTGALFVGPGSWDGRTGVLTVPGVIAAGQVNLASAVSILPVDSGQIKVMAPGNTAGVGLNVATDAVLKIRTRTQTGYATVDALGYAVSGVPGASRAAGPVNSITVVNGLITAIS